MKANLFFIVLAVVFMIFYCSFIYRMEKHSDPPVKNLEQHKE